MKHCDACNVDFTGDMARCPLCQNELRGETSPAAFPAQQIYLRPRRLAVRGRSITLRGMIYLMPFAMC